MGFDQLMAFYQKYTVVASKCTIEFVVQAVPQVVGIQLVPVAGVAYSDYVGILENGMCVHKVVPVLCSIPMTLSLEQVTAKSLGDVDALDDPGVSGTASTDPAEVLQFAIFHQDVNRTSIGTLQYVVTIDYDIIFSTPIQPAQS